MARNVRERQRPVSERLRCEMCGFSWTRPVQGGRRPKFCSDACKQRDYRQRVREEQERAAQEQAAERMRRWQEEQRRAEQERERQERARREREQQHQRGGGGGRGGSSSSAFRRGGLSLREAKAIVFRLAGVSDNGVTSLKAAYKQAALRCHPDHHGHGSAEDFKLLQAARAALKQYGLL